MVGNLESDRDERSINEVLIALQRLDDLLAAAAGIAKEVYGSEAADDRYRGLHISQAEVERLLRREPGEPLLYEAVEEFVSHDLSCLDWLQQVYRLSPFERDILVIALAPDFDLRYERLYAYLQDDVTRKRPTIDLALNLLCASRSEKLRQRAAFAPDAPLLRHRLIQFVPPAHQAQPPLLAYAFKLDEQIAHFLLGQTSLDSRLMPFCQWVVPMLNLEPLPLAAAQQAALQTLVTQSEIEQQPLNLYFQGSDNQAKRRVAEWLASDLEVPLLVAHLQRALNVEDDFERVLKLLLREAWFRGALLYLEDVDALWQEERSPHLEPWVETLAAHGGITILSGRQPWSDRDQQAIEMITIPFIIPDFGERRRCWQWHLEAAGMELAGTSVDVLADCFRLTSGQIANAVTRAQAQLRWQQVLGSREAPDSISPLKSQLQDFANQNQRGLKALFAAARAQSGHELATLARKLEPVHFWKDLVLPPKALVPMREICQRVMHHHQVLAEWGFDRKLSQGKGISALFVGPSGTGKTMAAEVIANELGLDLYKIDLSGVVSKYIGETEKNLERIFRAAENTSVILFFDEADALFGKRSEVRDSHDRYANLEISYLLQKMEQYEGIAILATNLHNNLDEAFIRRLAFTVHFPPPDEESRRQIWQGIWAEQVPLAEDVDLNFLARQFKLSGGNIKNIALAAAFLAATDGTAVSMTHLLQATQREYQKLGKVLTEAELQPKPKDE
ncbi:MAG: ATP-binding protein [Elainella sp. Prado103]|jgi:hypothetical protein|nr:ATP-binding protein [Elainella sp. Prado103]